MNKMRGFEQAAHISAAPGLSVEAEIGIRWMIATKITEIDVNDDNSLADPRRGMNEIQDGR